MGIRNVAVGAIGAVALVVSACVVGEDDDGIEVIDAPPGSTGDAAAVDPRVEELDGSAEATPSKEDDDTTEAAAVEEATVGAGQDRADPDDRPNEEPPEDLARDDGPLLGPDDAESWPDPADSPDGSERDGLDAALVTWHDLPTELADDRWGPPAGDVEGVSSPVFLHHWLAECDEGVRRGGSSGGTPEPDASQGEFEALVERLGPIPEHVDESVFGQHRQFLMTDSWTEITHTIDRVADGPSARWHVEHLDALVSSCHPGVSPDPDVSEGFVEPRGGGIAPLDVPSLGEGSTGWRVTVAFPGAHLYRDHVRWYQDDVLVTITVSWIPRFRAFRGEEPGASEQAEAQTDAAIAELLAALDQKLSEVRARD